MTTLNRIGVLFASYLLTIMVGLGVAHAGQVTVTYKTFPSGPVLDTNVITGCDTATAQSFPDYEFLFWNNQGKIVFSKTTSICPGSGNTTATAWYLPAPPCPTGQTCGCPTTGCEIITYAFSIDHNEVLASGTPIALVAPNAPPPAWVPGSTVVNTSYANESISAKSSLAFPPHAAEPFRFWQILGATVATPDGIVFQAIQNGSAYLVAFYGPDPCQTLRNELTACLQSNGTNGPLVCAPLGKALQVCEQQNRELN